MGAPGELLEPCLAAQHRQRGGSTVSGRQLTPEALMAKADTACSSARVLLNLGDVDGASNRAYYAMFDAARAALLASGASVEPDVGRTHSGLIGAFGNYL